MLGPGLLGLINSNTTVGAEFPGTMAVERLIVVRDYSSAITLAPTKSDARQGSDQ